jgi:hypothetical protein
MLACGYGVRLTVEFPTRRLLDLVALGGADKSCFLASAAADHSWHVG